MIFHKYTIDPLKSKIDLDIKLKSFIDYRLIKSTKYPILYINDTRKKGHIIDLNQVLLTAIDNNIKRIENKKFRLDNMYNIYKEFTPRNIGNYNINSIQSISDYYLENKKIENYLMKILGNKLIFETDDTKESNFIFDDEVTNFMIKMDSKKFTYDKDNIKINNNKVFFQEILNPSIIKEKFYSKNFIISVEVSSKVMIFINKLQNVVFNENWM